ncbi:hypothetical protein B0T24DRAFT_406456 [Lasiosphaeria ovina]|uniref:C2H2-type domain-containing protein n=1 Tax=Lasiosphaeria ovina TaxID=92902 RepID=A0AAE0JXQ3_9PEZI|nr:hypothetical protein B0T24DRAFT_406456 [Lasiosphaeria ovina]
MMPYDSRPVTSPPVQRPGLAPHFFTSPSFTAATMANVTAPQYQTHGPYGGYTSYSSSSALGSPFKHHHYPERPQLRIMSSKLSTGREPRYSREDGSSVEGSLSPSIKSESQMSAANSTTSNPPSLVRSVEDASTTPTSQIIFNTPLDALMKTIQSKGETEAGVNEAQPSVEQVRTPTSPYHRLLPQRQRLPQIQAFDEKSNQKRFHCNIPGCGKSFYQKTHLDIHIRAHTGERPYTCEVPNCGERFSQLGNLKTHERRHTGARPYSCEMCGKRFAQRGNVRAHMKTHDKTKPYVCRLDNCNKAFTQLGNLKSHQNKFHINTVTALTNKFAALTDYDTVSQADRDLWEYFANLYKNSNKGIKGRGKHRKVEPVAQLSPVPPTPGYPSHSQTPLLSSCHGLPNVLHTPHSVHQSLPFQGLSHPAAYSMSRSNLLLNPSAREAHNGYEMIDAENASVSSSGHGPSTHGPVYDEDHGRELAFGDRIY